MPRPLKIGIEVPITERKGVEGTPRWADVLAMARHGEEVGLDSVWVEDHLIFQHPGREAQGAWECWMLLAAIAAATERVEIGPLVTCVPFRNPALLAKMAETVDEISNGRLILGLGAGWNETEFSAFGFPYDHRVSRFEEALTIISGLLKDGRVDFQGRFHEARDCELRPRGPRPQGPPVLLGTIGERMLKLTAQHADIWNAYFTHTRNRAANVAPLRDKVDAACEVAGRDPATLERTAGVLIAFGEPGPESFGPHWDFPPLTGSPEEIATELRAYADESISHLILWLEPNTIESIERLVPVLELMDA